MQKNVLVSASQCLSAFKWMIAFQNGISDSDVGYCVRLRSLIIVIIVTIVMMMMMMIIMMIMMMMGDDDGR